MAHSHDHSPVHVSRIFVIAIVLNLLFVAVEAFYGYWSGSLALFADAGHNLSDVFGLFLGLGANVLSQRIPSPRRTYGLRRSSILAALANSIILLVAVGGIGWEAILRFGNPGTISGEIVIWVAAAGIVINTFSALLFLSGNKSDLNSKGAFLHLAADAGVSLGVVLGGVVILQTGWTWLDPLISLIIVGVILVSTWGLLRTSINLALDAVPENIDPAEVENYLKSINGVQSVHDLHIWGMSTTETALTAHLIMPEVTRTDSVISKITKELHERFEIEHTTIQIERVLSEEDCKQSSPTVV